MLAWALTAENAQLFFELCEEMKANTEEKRIRILMEMARLGKVQNLTKTTMTKEKYIEHLSKNFKVAEIKNNGDIGPIMPDSQPKENNSNG